MVCSGSACQYATGAVASLVLAAAGVVLVQKGAR
jgi:hypothetical protein